jgi:hypothetical protein
MLNLTPYHADKHSAVLYLGDPQVLAVQAQHTEFGKCLLDLELSYVSPDGSASGGKFLLRLEGSTDEITVLANAIHIALRHPRPHPSPGDLFEAALIDRSGYAETMRGFYEEATQDRSHEVERARALSPR